MSPLCDSANPHIAKQGLSIPMSSSVRLSAAVGDKLNVSCLLASTTTVCVPLTLAFMYMPEREYDDTSGAHVVKLESVDPPTEETRAMFMEAVTTFLATAQPPLARVVIKPTGVSPMLSVPVRTASSYALLLVVRRCPIPSINGCFVPLGKRAFKHCGCSV